MPKKWIKKAIKNPGALTRTAKAKGMSVATFCAQPKSKLSATSRRR
jgi:hypothetical protein